MPRLYWDDGRFDSTAHQSDNTILFIVTDIICHFVTNVHVSVPMLAKTFIYLKTNKSILIKFKILQKI